MHVQNRDARTGEHHKVTVASTLKRVVDGVAAHLRPKPDLSLVNEKFTDSFERERTELLLRNRW